jgi:cytochrome c556
LSTVQAALAEMQNAAKVMPAQYPENAKTGGETRALPKIWETKSDFDARFVKLNKDAADAAGKIKDEATFKTTYAEVTKNCDSCHDSYRKAR